MKLRAIREQVWRWRFATDLALHPTHRAPIPLVAVAGLLAVKLGFLFAYGPTFLPDSGGYADIGKFILAGRLSDPALTGGIFPPTLFRIMGYPAIIALAMAA